MIFFINYLSKLTSFTLIVLAFSIFILIKPQFTLAAEGDSCPGTVYYPNNCVAGSAGSCTATSRTGVACQIHNGTCQGNIVNQICDYSASVGGCSLIPPNPGYVWIPCGDTGGGTCSSECRAGSSCGTGFTSAAGCSGTGPNFGCSSTQVCCKANSCSSAPTPTPGGCTRTCQTVTECRRADNCSGSQGAGCGTATDGTPKKQCTYQQCTTVCPSTPTPGDSNPKGYLDNASCTQSQGWACDSSDYSQALQIHFYADGPAGAGGVYIGSTTANQAREQAVADQCGGNPNHGYTFAYPAAYQSGNHTIYAYAINVGTGSVNTLLTNSPRSYSCPLTSTPHPIAYCQDIRAYDQNFGLLSNTQLTQLVAGSKAYFCALGYSSGTTGKFVAIRLNVNGVLTPESTTVRPGSFDFCYLYTVPSATYNFNIVAQLKHEVLGWVN